MAKPIAHTDLPGMGWKPEPSEFNGSSDRTGVAMTHHYTMTRPFGNTTLTHHLYVDEFGRNPGKPNVAYRVTHAGRTFAGGHYDTLRRHVSNDTSGVRDPIGEVLDHHRWADSSIKQQDPQPPLISVTPDNIHTLIPGGHDGRLQSFNSVQDQPLDAEVYRVLTSGTGGHRFIYQGRFPGDDGTDLYQVAHPDPASPNTFEYGFTVRHRPGETRPFSYNAMRYQSGLGDNGEEDPGSFLDVTGNMDHVANFGTLAQLVRRHQDILKALKIKSSGTRPRMSAVEKTADEFDDITGGNGYAGPCWACGKATYNYPEGTSFRDDKSYPINAQEETGGNMHGPDINLCGVCSQDQGAYQAAVSRGAHGAGRLWHYPEPEENHEEDWEGGPDASGQHFSSRKAARLMDQADDDLRP